MNMGKGRTLAKLAWLLVLAAPALALAHEGHEHTVMGTVKVADTTHIEVQSGDGKTVSLRLDEKTKCVRGKSAASRSDIKPGERVVVLGIEEKGGSLRAQEVRFASGKEAAAVQGQAPSGPDASFKALLAAYEGVSKALVQDDLAAAKKAATVLAEQVRTAGQPEIASHAAELAKSDALAAAREHFKALSAGVIGLAPGKHGYHVMTCPMVEADWVQSSEVVANPYMGQKMVSCGMKKPPPKG